MITSFWWVSIIITLLFFISIAVIFVCQWIVYFRIERTTLAQMKLNEKEEKGR